MPQIKKIYFASSALFSLSACVFGWAAPIGAALVHIAAQQMISIIVRKSSSNLKMQCKKS